MTDNVIKFPKSFKKSKSSIAVTVVPLEEEFDRTHHEEIFEYDDGSYVILILPKELDFTIERMVYMAERVKRTMFDCEKDYFDENSATVDDPNDAS